MDFNHKAIKKITGLLALILGLSLILPCFIAYACGEHTSLRAFVITSAISVTAGLVLLKSAWPADVYELKARDGFFTVFICFISASAAGALPYVLSGEIPGVIDAFFESVSGFTTTGATVLDDIESHSRSVLFWRSFTQWLGGAGVLVFAVALLPVFEKLTSKKSGTATTLIAVYAVFTVLNAVFLMICGLTPYDAAAYAFSTVSTGGFSVCDSPAPLFESVPIRAVSAIFMIIGGISFKLYFSVLRRGPAEFFKNIEFKLFIALIPIFSALVFVNFLSNDTFGSAPEAASHAVLRIISTITTTGYITDDAGRSTLFCSMIIFTLMFIGACSSSVGGGVKVIRALIFFKFMTRGIFIRLHPNAVVPIKLFDKALTGDAISKAVNFIFLYAAVIFAGSILISLENLDMMSTVSAVASTLGNVGPMLSETGSTSDYTVFSYPAKLLFALFMMMGRLELFAVIMLAVPKFWRPNR